MSTTFNPTPSLEGAPGDGGEGTRASSLDAGDNVHPLNTDDTQEEPSSEELDWMQLQRTAFNKSSDWMQAQHYAQWERNIHNFQSLHPPGSKYRTTRYSNRNRLFRPMTRTTMRKLEEAYTRSITSASSKARVRAQDPDNDTQAAAAKLVESLLNERMEHTIPWYQINVGVVQDCEQHGFCLTHQYWEFKDGLDGTPELDRPVVEPVPPENIRFDEAASWLDPINDSPFVIQMIPMFAQDIVDRGSWGDDRTGQPAWKQYTLEQITTAFQTKSDTVRQSRHGVAQDPKNDGVGTDLTSYGYEHGFVHRNIFRREGEDWIFYTVGTSLILTEAVRLKEVYPWLRSGERPYAYGTMMCEAHKAVPASPVEMGQSIQASANDIANRRQDNVELAMDKRYFLRRSANIDRAALYASVPGGSIETDDPVADVRIEETRDVTSSAYAEQDRLNMDMDELFGAYSNSTVMANRKQNETVGGMQMQASNAEGQADLYVQSLQQTWYKTVLGQLVRLEQFYETDIRIMSVAAKRAGVWMQIDNNSSETREQQLTKMLVTQELTIKIETGISATNPVHRINMLMAGVENMAKFPGLQRRIDEDAVAAEIFSALGFGDGARFLLPKAEGEQSEEIQQLQQRIQELESGLATEQLRADSREKVARTQALVKLAELEDDNAAKLWDSLIRAEKNEISMAELDLTRKEAVVSHLEMRRSELLAQEVALENNTNSNGGNTDDSNE